VESVAWWIGGIAMRSLIRIVLLLLTFLPATSASAGEIKPFDQATFDRLQSAGKPVVIHVHAGWCPTCRQQNPIIDALMKRPEYATFTVLKVDYDTQKDVRAALHVKDQSTLIVFRGRNEVARTVADVNPQTIAATLRKAS
jgi:thioredoxin 1